jgi:hypothetical protein
MTSTIESTQQFTDVDDRAGGGQRVEDHARLAVLEWPNAADLLAITPEQLQLLATTGC